MPSHTVTLRPDGLQVDLRGLARAGALRGRVVVPFERVTGVSTDSLHARPRLWRVGGYGWRATRYGTFRQGGEWKFLATRAGEPVLRLALRGDGPERVRYAEVVLSDPDAGRLAERVRAALSGA